MQMHCQARLATACDKPLGPSDMRPGGWQGVPDNVTLQP